MIRRYTAPLLASLALAACSQSSDGTPAGAAPAEAPVPATAVQESPAMSLVINDIKEGDGAAVGPGQAAVVHYTGWLFDGGAPEAKGEKFDSSHDHGQTFTFRIGAGEVIPGWDQGVAGMKVGGQRRLVIPPELGYGARGAGGVIPPNATLVFDVELVGIQ